MIEPDLSGDSVGEDEGVETNSVQQPTASGSGAIIPVLDDSIERPSDDAGPSSGDEDMSDGDDWDLDPALAGFRFCSEEAVRFLVEEEGFAVDDPVVLQLQRHLAAQRSRLQDRCQQQQRGQPSSLHLESRDGDDSGVGGPLLQFQVTPGEEPSLSETDQGFADMSSDVLTSP